MSAESVFSPFQRLATSALVVVVALSVIVILAISQELDATVVVAIITSGASLLVAFIGYFTARKSQQDLELLRSELAERRAQKNARIEYEYDARQRLYREFEPLLFQLVELSEVALDRIRGLARTARLGSLGDKGWLSFQGYYFRSTLYRLLAPMAVVRMIQYRLTFMDLHLEPFIRAQYTLAKKLYSSFNKDWRLANTEPKLDYDPDFLDDKDDKVREELRIKNPAKYWRQGIYAGTLDKAVNALIERGEEGSLRYLSFGEFEKLVESRKSDLESVRYLFTLFHPYTKPVLWRILIVQAYLYYALIRAQELRGQEGVRGFLTSIPEEDRISFDWRQDTDTVSEEEVFDEPFQAAERYLKKDLGSLFVSDVEEISGDVRD
ncbi:MAG: hypothetical protein ACFFER_15790 [Candidatus Thorarchaeota archaeon]